jgi:hypothetical protein
VPEEITPGQPVPEPSPAPEPAPATEATPPAPVLPGKLAGKSAEEIASQYLELEKKLGEQGRELGELRQRIPQFQQPPPYYPPQVAPPEPKEEFNYADPEGSINRMWDKRFAEKERQRVYQESSRNATEAELSFRAGMELATQRNPRLYEGIEAEMEKAAQMAVRDYGTLPAALRSTKTLDSMAAAIRWERGEVDRLVKQTPQPPQPSPTAVPNQTRTSKAAIELDEKSRAMAKAWGLSEQEAKEIIERETEGGGR